MASVATVTIQGAGVYLVDITDTLVGTTDEAEIEDMPPVGHVVRQECIRTNGDGATVDPILGWLTDPATNPQSVICENDTPFATVDTEGTATYIVPVAQRNASGMASLFHRSRYSAGANNNGTGSYIIKAGLPTD